MMPASDTQFKKVHGHAMNGKHPASRTYICWQSMKQRCQYEKHKSFYIYGAIGVRICERWQDFAAFLEDMGEAPVGHTLDRFPDAGGNYEPGNCRWATPSQQARNRKNSVYVEAFGKKRLLIEWCEQYGVACDTFRWGLKSGLAPEVALTRPVAKCGPQRTATR
jgi:hypothetical protein